MEKCSAVIMMAGSRHVHPYNTLEDHEISPQVMDNGDTSLGNGDKKKKRYNDKRMIHSANDARKVRRCDLPAEE